jgi:hypothetical protein
MHYDGNASVQTPYAKSLMQELRAQLVLVKMRNRYILA